MHSRGDGPLAESPLQSTLSHESWRSRKTGNYRGWVMCWRCRWGRPWWEFGHKHVSLPFPQDNLHENTTPSLRFSVPSSTVQYNSTHNPYFTGNFCCWTLRTTGTGRQPGVAGGVAPLFTTFKFRDCCSKGQGSPPPHEHSLLCI